MGKAAPVGEEQLSRIAASPVLSDRVLDVLAVERVLELGREDGDAVQEEHEVEAFLTVLAEAELAHYGEEVGRVQALQLLVEPARWPEVRQPELAARVLDAVSQHVECPPPTDLAREPAEEARLHVSPVVLLELLPFHRLGGQEEIDDVGWNQAEPPVVVLRSALAVAPWHRLVAVRQRRLLHCGRIARAGIGPVPQQRALDRLLEGPLRDLGTHDASSRTSIWPVTAAEMSAVRNSLSRSMAW